MAHKVIAINGWWATVISSVLVTAVCSGFAFAFSMNNEVVAMKRDLQPIVDAKLTVEVPVIREQISQIKGTTQRMEQQQERMDDKLDKVLRQTAEGK